MKFFPYVLVIITVLCIGCSGRPDVNSAEQNPLTGIKDLKPWTIDHGAIGSEVTDINGRIELLRLLTSAISRDLASPWDRVLMTAEGFRKSRFYRYKNVPFGKEELQAFYVRLADFDASDIEVVMAVSPEGGSEYCSLILYEKIAAETDFERHAFLQYPRIVLSSSLDNSEQVVQAVVFRNGSFLDHFDRDGMFEKMFSIQRVKTGSSGTVKNQLKTGKWEETRSFFLGELSGRLQSAGEYKDGKRTNKWTEKVVFSENDANYISATGHYENGWKKGVWTFKAPGEPVSVTFGNLPVDRGVFTDAAHTGSTTIPGRFSGEYYATVFIYESYEAEIRPMTLSVNFSVADAVISKSVNGEMRNENVETIVAGEEAVAVKLMYDDVIYQFRMYEGKCYLRSESFYPSDWILMKKM